MNRISEPAYMHAGANHTHRYAADWLDERHHLRRFASEFFGTFGFVFILSSGAAILHAFSPLVLPPALAVFLLTLAAAMWLVIAIYAFGDISAHFNPAMSFAFALRGDMSWRRSAAYCAIQCAGACAASLIARAFFGASSGLAAVHAPTGLRLATLCFEALLTFFFVLLVLAEARGPKLNGPFTPLAVAAAVMALGTIGGLFEGAAFNPARALGPDVATGNSSDWWVYALGAMVGATVAVAFDRYLRGAASSDEAAMAESEH